MDIPFAFEKIAAGNGIVGRSQEIDTIVSALGPGGNSLVIYGEARSGKETVVTEALERYRARKSGLIVCTIDLLGIRTYDDFIALWRAKMKECAVEVNRGALLPFEICIDEIAPADVDKESCLRQQPELFFCQKLFCCRRGREA